MKTSRRFDCLAVLIVMMLILGSSLPAHAADPVEQIPPGPTTWLPDYVGAPAKAHPTANSGVPQNPFRRPNPFSHSHSDIWMSDTADIAGPLGRDPVTLSTTLPGTHKNS